MQQESVDINIGILIPRTTDIRLLTYRGMRFCCISSLAAAAADDYPTIWQPLFPPDGDPFIQPTYSSPPAPPPPATSPITLVLSLSLLCIYNEPKEQLLTEVDI